MTEREAMIQAMKAPHDTIVVEHTAGLKFAMRLNGFYINLSDAADVRKDIQADPWVKPGENLMTLDIDVGGSAPAAGTEPKTLTVRIYEHSELKPESGRELARFEWKEGKGSHNPVVRFNIDNPPPSDVWGHAELMTELKPGQRGEVIALVKRLVATYEKKDYQQFDLQTKYCHEDVVKALRWPPGTPLGPIKEFMKEAMGESGWSVPQILWEDVTTDLIAGGQVVAVRRGAEPLVSFKAGEEGHFPVVLEPYVSKINGRWEIVRCL